MLGLYRDKYADFTVKHFHEQLVKRHNYRLGYTVTKLALHAAGVVRPAPKRSAHRKKRPRRPLRGMLLHQDGSRHAWLEGQPALDLIATMDDATSEVLSLFLVAEEGTASTFRGLREVVSEHGLFCALYTDRGSHYFETPKAGGKVSRTQLTQVGRALQQLGIEHIAAYSPEARGRSERLFRTLQDRLPKELRLAGIATVEAANAWLKDRYVGEHNRQFRLRQRRRAPRSCRTARGRGVTSCAWWRSGWSATTIRLPGTAVGCSCRRAASGRRKRRRDGARAACAMSCRGTRRSAKIPNRTFLLSSLRNERRRS